MGRVLESQADLALLLGAVTDLSQARLIEDVTAVVRVAARELSGADGVSFVLRDGENCYYADENAIEPLWKGKRFPLESCISGWAMIHRQAVSIPDVYSDSRIPIEAYRPTFVKSLVMVPVRREDPIAAIGAYWAEHHLPTDREIRLLQTLADSTALVLANVELNQDLRKKVVEIEALYERAKQEMKDREKLEVELRQAQKMEAIGRLASGVAHDFNNLLTIIAGYTDLILENIPPDSGFREELAEIRDAGIRASSLTRQLLAFSRKQVLQPVVLDLNEVVERMSRMILRLIGEDIDLVANLRPNLHPVEFDPGQIEQIVMNLAVNARDAMPKGGKLTLETANVQLDEEYAHSHPDAQPGPHVMIAVSDSGIGMDAETKARIFEPFFTTKDPGKGTGLGLSTVYGIVKQSGGNIWVYSELGLGTTFKIYLPLASKEGVVVDSQTVVAERRGTGGCILLVEDDTAVRNLIRRVLVRSGYRVLDSGSPEEALELCRRHAAEIDLLLTDMVMPRMGGLDLAAKALEILPNLKVVYMSGYTDDAVVHRGLLGPGSAFIEKPITPDGLLRKLEDFLSSP